MSSDTKSIARSFDRPGLVLALISLPVFIGALDLTIVSAVLPNVILDLKIPFQTGADDAAWMVSGYLLAYTVSVAVMGRISDLMGRRRTYFVSLLIFILGSWLVATATFAPTEWMRRIVRLIQGGRPDTAYMSLYALIAGRIIQALGAGAMVPVSMALVGDLYPPERRATALGVVGAVDTAGWVLGHLYGGLMVQIVAWPVLFWLNIPITTAIAIITWRRLAPIADSHNEGGLTRPGLIVLFAGVGLVTALSAIHIFDGFVPEIISGLASSLLRLRWLATATALLLLAGIGFVIAAARRIEGTYAPNWLSTLLLIVALAGLNIGLGGEPSADATFESAAPLEPYAIAALVIAVVALAVFVVAERRTEHPLFDFAHFRDRNVSLSSTINLMVGFCLMVGLVSVPLFVNAVIATNIDEAALLSGILLGALTIPMALASIPGGMLAERVGYRIPTALGMAIAVVGFYMGRTWVPDIAQGTMAWHMALAGIGLGLTVAPIGASAINAVRAEEHGVTAALVLVMRLIGMTLSTSVMTRYGLRRSTALTEAMVAELGGSLDVNALFEIGLQVATTIINEMLVIAAVVAAAAVIPSLLLRPRDKPAPEREG